MGKRLTSQQQADLDRLCPKPAKRSADTLQDLQQAPVVGNAHHDMPLLKRFDAYLHRNDVPEVNKLLALDHLQRNVMGCSDAATATPADLAAYLAG